jgi:hypothetical protein
MRLLLTVYVDPAAGDDQSLPAIRTCRHAQIQIFEKYLWINRAV